MIHRKQGTEKKSLQVKLKTAQSHKTVVDARVVTLKVFSVGVRKPVVCVDGKGSSWLEGHE